MANAHKFTTPTGRLIGGSLYTTETTDYDGKPLVIKSGQNAGQPTQRFSIGVAIPKTPGCAHWANEPWGGPIWALAHAAFVNGETQRPDFAWKITDGDSQIPNKRGKKPCDSIGYPGNWVIWMSSAQAPRAAALNGAAPEFIMEPQAIKPGYYVQVLVSVIDNKPSQSPGLYWNPAIVCRIAYGEEIIQGPSLADATFGATSLPPGASAVPVGVATLPNLPPAPGPASASPAVPAPVAPVSAAPVTPPVPVHPAPSFVQVPPPPSAPVAPPAPPAAPGGLPPGRMWLNPTYTYAQFKADPQWTDDALVANGHMR